MKSIIYGSFLSLAILTACAQNQGSSAPPPTHQYQNDQLLADGSAMPSTTYVAGTCQGPMVFKLVDQNNAAVNAPSDLNIYLSGNSTAFYRDSACSSNISGSNPSITIAANTSSSQVYFISFRSGANQIVGSSSIGAADSAALTVQPGPSSFLLANKTTITHSVCTLVNIQDYDSFSNSVADTFNLTFQGSILAYSDSSCTIPVTSMSTDYSDGANLYLLDNVVNDSSAMIHFISTSNGYAQSIPFTVN